MKKVKLIIPLEGALPKGVTEEKGEITYWEQGRVYNVPDDFHMADGYYYVIGGDVSPKSKGMKLKAEDDKK